MDNPHFILQLLVGLAVGGPAVAAAACALLGRSSARTARRVAVSAAILHLGVTGLLAAVAYPALAIDWSTPTGFEPVGVPGDWSADGRAHATTWSLLTLAPAGGPARGGYAVPPAEVQFYVGVDGLNVWLVVLTGVMTLVAVLVSDSVQDRAGAYYGWLFVLAAAVTGAFLAFDVLLFYTFFELTLVPAFFLIGRWGVGGGRRDAARKFFLYTLFGSLLTLTGLVGVVLTNPTPLDPEGHGVRQVARNAAGGFDLPTPGPLTFSIPELMRNVQTWATVRAYRAADAADAADRTQATARTAANALAANPSDPVLGQASTAASASAEAAGRAREAADAAAGTYRTVQTWLFFALMCGFAVKIPVVPLHTWLPAAYGEAPLPVTMLLSALLAKLGTYGVLRVVLPLAPGPAVEYGLAVFGTLGAAGIVYAAFCAYAQRDMKLVVAYSSISHLGLVVVALFTGTAAGLTGAALHMVNHGLSTGAMFALLGFLYARYKTTDMAQYGGLFARFPGFTWLFILVSLASVGLPLLNNFASEMLMMAALFEPTTTRAAGYGLAAAAAAGIFLSAWYTFTLVRRVFFGPVREPAAAGPVPVRLTSAERAAFGLPALLCVALGVYPQPVIDTIRPNAETLTRQADFARNRAGLLRTFEKPSAAAPAR